MIGPDLFRVSWNRRRAFTLHGEFEILIVQVVAYLLNRHWGTKIELVFAAQKNVSFSLSRGKLLVQKKNVALYRISSSVSRF